MGLLKLLHLEYSVLDHPLVQARLHLPPDQFQQRPESQMVRSLYHCPEIPVGPEGVRCRVVVVTHPAGKKKSPVGVTRAGVVYELFLTNLPQQGFTACDVVELYLYRGAFDRRLHRRACIGLLHHQRVEITLPQTMPAEPRHSEGILSRAQRAYSRLS